MLFLSNEEEYHYFLSNEEEKILDGDQGDLLSKLMKLIVTLGDSFGAEKLIEIVSAIL